MRFRTEGEYRGNIVLSESFIRSDMAGLSEKATKVYLACLLLAHGKQNAELETVSKYAGADMEQTISALRELEHSRLISLSSTSIKILFPATVAEEFAPAYVKAYTPEEVFAIDDEEMPMLIGCVEKAFGRMLSHADIGLLAGLYREIGIPSPVLAIMIEYVASVGKKSMGYLKTIALDWNAKEIDSPSKAHAYITYLEQQQDYYESVRNCLGVFGRSFTKKEREFLDSWKDKFSLEEIKEAYEKTVDNTGKISFAYTNKILNSDPSLAPKTPSVKTPSHKRSAPSKFNNFSQKPKDYNNVKEKARDKLKELSKKL